MGSLSSLGLLQGVYVGGAASGKSTFDSVCTACHGTGLAGAPKFGDKAAMPVLIDRIKPLLDWFTANVTNGDFDP